MSHETNLQKLLLLAAPARFPYLRLFRRNVGTARMPSGAVVEFAVSGQADLYGILRGGKLVEIELKNVGKKLKPDQVAWQKFCGEWGVPHLILTAEKNETDQQTIDRWCDEIAVLVSKMGFAI